MCKLLFSLFSLLQQNQVPVYIDGRLIPSQIKAVKNEKKKEKKTEPRNRRAHTGASAAERFSNGGGGGGAMN